MMVEVETTRFLLYFSGEFASYRVNKSVVFGLFFTEHSMYDYKFSRFYLLISFFHTILKLSQWKAVTSMKMSIFFKKSFWSIFLIVHQTIILLYLKDGLDRQYLTTDSIHWVIGTFIFANILVAMFSNMKIGNKEKNNSWSVPKTFYMQSNIQNIVVRFHNI